ncbi:LapA family protein [Lusitaniella coriacea LEGE 07157]|uniref:LapA family protein n=1 Tax=Lusitaniella coriacea LEGE 07157 TaxID=945747 RepID=A0A8J7DSK8_9CYAN|nr:LapA family protein [Lusitaniella coriacea]MBE9114277.1 LapA family protein [Lusitaniella coriacea LEGE 07157]
MKRFANLLSAILVAAWVGAIAVFSVQNYTLISLKFLVFETIQMPVGVVLAFCFGTGLVGGATIPLLLRQSRTKARAAKRIPAGSRKGARSDYGNSLDEDDPLENWE